MAQRPEVAGVGISHPDRVMFPDARATKLDLARYWKSRQRRPRGAVRALEGM